MRKGGENEGTMMTPREDALYEACCELIEAADAVDDMSNKPRYEQLRDAISKARDATEWNNMEEDIAERLRSQSKLGSGSLCRLLGEAAAEIERLRIDCSHVPTMQGLIAEYAREILRLRAEVARLSIYEPPFGACSTTHAPPETNNA